VTTASWRLRGLLLVIGAGFALFLGTTLSRFTNAALPFMDSTLTSYSLVGQFLMTRKLIDNWVVWIVVDVAYVGMFVFKELYLTAGLYAVFLVLAVMGLAGWARSMTGASGRADGSVEAA
jgi:nicotinamide mononucleotide transporter